MQPRSWTGELHIMPNGSITQVTNFSLNNSIAVVDMPLLMVKILNGLKRSLKTT
jgi:small conductance mechanosensitive channel